VVYAAVQIFLGEQLRETGRDGERKEMDTVFLVGVPEGKKTNLET
jgi:hypothetical protein